MLRKCLLIVGCVVGFLLIVIGVAFGWYYFSLIHDPELERLERASAETCRAKSGDYGTYDSFLKQLLDANRVFYVLPPLVCSGFDKLSEDKFPFDGSTWIRTDWRKETGTICDVPVPIPVSEDDDDSYDGPYYRSVQTVIGGDFNTFGYYIVAIIWVPLKDGMAALYFVDADRSIVRKETLSFLRLRIFRLW